MSDALFLSVDQTENKEMVVTMTVDEEWLAKEERVFPVTIDPWTFTETTKEAIDSTFITSGKPSANHYDKLIMFVGRESSVYEYCRSLIKIELPELNPGDMVVNAKLNILMYQMATYCTGIPDLQNNAHRVTENWDHTTVTWNSCPKYDATVLDYVMMGEDDFANEEFQKDFDITEAVKGWYENDYSNYGIELKLDSEKGDYADNGIIGYFWPERYNSEEASYPRYVITYRNNKGLEAIHPADCSELRGIWTDR